MRTVISIEPVGSIDATGGDSNMVKVVRSPWTVPQQTRAFPLSLSAGNLSAWDVPDAVRVRGQQVRMALIQHPGIARLLDLMPSVPTNSVAPFYVMLNEGDAELIGWETLCDAQDDFVAVDSRSPIGRIVEPQRDETRAPTALRMPIRVMAVISALGAAGQPEWNLLFEAVSRARDNGLDVHLKVLVGDAALRTIIDTAVARHAPWLSVSPIARLGTMVVQDIADWKPQIVHFFCHGLADDSDQSLELATAQDYTSRATNGSVKISTTQLVGLLEFLPNPWLLTLNCCSSGRAARTLNSMAHRAVLAGFPAAVAMLEPVTAGDAYLFTGTFYRTMFDQIGAAKQRLATAEQTAFEWLRPISVAREALVADHDSVPASSREWSLPVLYVRGVAPFMFWRPVATVPSNDEAADHKRRAAIVARWLVTTGAGVSVQVRKEAIEAALFDVPREFWPSVDGTWQAAGGATAVEDVLPLLIKAFEPMPENLARGD
jgi:hypothetical protein